LLSLEERRQRALQLWAIGIRKAKIIKQIINVIKLYGASKIIDENLNLDGDQDGIKCIAVMDPNSKFSQGWAMVTTTSLMITGLYVPYNAAFGDVDETFNVESFLLDVPFYFDIIFGFFTGYRNSQGMLEKRVFQVVINYLKTWFFIDMLTIVPYEVIFTSNTFSFIKFIKFLKVFKFIRMFKYVNRIKEIAAKYDISIITLRLLAEAIAVVYLVHIAA
jgi:hypothetical protein